ncbi:hypothetical protein G7009_09660 [Pseudomonas capeferrum]|uniref:hypothetical protein n=1 Tax=Pseudomonas capeferrum TaxID=1495066 RepID=UPI0015E2D77F|nr:hypothetical protein [Pseudomonas capeferrum]MBA1202025.1 hypothetical protein [Pseudomonas capeferrum]
MLIRKSEGTGGLDLPPTSPDSVSPGIGRDSAGKGGVDELPENEGKTFFAHE